MKTRPHLKTLLMCLLALLFIVQPVMAQDDSERLSDTLSSDSLPEDSLFSFDGGIADPSDPIALETPAEATPEPEEVKTPKMTENDKIFNALPPETQMEILDETEKMHKKCQGQFYMGTFYDCSCLAVQFMNERLLRPGKEAHNIMIDVKDSCPNVPGVAGYAFDTCNRLTYDRTGPNKTKYCECFGNTVAQMFAENPVGQKDVYASYSTSAYLSCASQIPP